MSHVLFPTSCVLCKGPLATAEPLICSLCWVGLPRTRQIEGRCLAMEMKLWGLVPLDFTFALFSFNRGGKVRRLIHLMKYHGSPQLAYEVGVAMGASIRENGFGIDWDYIIPVPLHVAKFQKRGFNQSEALARGLSKVLCVPLKLALSKNQNQTTQTHLNRWHRFENVGDQFNLSDPTLIPGKVLLVDDVMTTGATLAACSQTLVSLGFEVSLAVAALTLGH